MKAKLTIEQGEIQQAVVERVQRMGWKVGKAKLIVQEGNPGDNREPSEPPSVRAEVEVEPMPPPMHDAGPQCSR